MTNDRIYRNARYVHPRRLTNMPAHFNTNIRIAHRTLVTNDFNEEIISYTDDPQLEDIRAYKEPKIATSGEDRDATQTIELNSWFIYLQGYFPTIRTLDLATVDGVPHNIINVAHDDSKTLTLLETEIVNASSDNTIPL